MSGGNGRLSKDSENYRISLKLYEDKSWNNRVYKTACVYTCLAFCCSDVTAETS